MEEWKKVEVDTFKLCCEKLKFDEFLRTDDFDSRLPNAAPVVGNKRLDLHVAAENCFSIDDLLKNTDFKLPDESLSEDEIRSICGFFFDQQMLRLDGVHPYTTVLTCVYIQKNYEIKNKILKILFEIFSFVTLKIEKYANNVGGFKNSFWSYDNEPEKYINVYKIEEIKKELKGMKLPNDISSLVDFELDLANLLDDPINNKMRDKYNIPVLSEPIGFSPFLHYRHLKFTFPPLVKKVEHKEMIKKLDALLHDIKEIKEKIYAPNIRRLAADKKEQQAISQMISSIYSWNERSEHLSIARFIAFDVIIGHSNDNVFFGKLSNSDLLEADLEPYGLIAPLKKSKNYSDLVCFFGSTIYPICKDLILPLPFMHSQLVSTDINVWRNFQSNAFTVFSMTCSEKTRTKCASPDHQQIEKNSFPLWSISIATKILYITYRSGFYCGLYGPNDYHIVWSMLDFSCSYEFSALDQLRTVRAIAVLNRRKAKKNAPLKGNEIEKEKEQKSQETRFMSIQASVFSGLAYLYKLLKNENAIEGVNGMFLNESKLYEERSRPATQVLHLSVYKYQEFLEDLNVAQETLKKRAIENMEKAKKMVSELIKEGYEKEECNEILKTIITASIIASSFSPGKKVAVKLGPFYPTFEFVKSK